MNTEDNTSKIIVLLREFVQLERQRQEDTHAIIELLKASLKISQTCNDLLNELKSIHNS